MELFLVGLGIGGILWLYHEWNKLRIDTRWSSDGIFSPGGQNYFDRTFLAHEVSIQLFFLITLLTKERILRKKKQNSS